MTHVTCRLTANNRDQLRNPTLGNRVRATFTFFTSNFCNWQPFFRCALCEAYSASADLLAEFKGRTKEEYRVGNGSNTGEATRVDGKGTEEEKKGDQHPSHARSPPTFQPWLRICSYYGRCSDTTG